MTDEPATEFVGLPLAGRVYSLRRTVALGDVNPNGAMRLDSLARMVQDVATADAADALPTSAYAYVLRRLAVRIGRCPVLGERLELRTFCGGTARSWAERRTVVSGSSGASVDTAAIWVPVDASGRPARLPDAFLGAYGEAAAGRRVEARRTHALPSDDLPRSPWPLRYVDLDTLGHVNNAAHWAPVEERLRGTSVRAAEIEFVSPLMGDDHAELVVAQHRNGFDSWLCAEGHVRSSQRVWFDR